MMNDRRSGGQPPAPDAGLCATCANVQIVTSAKGTVFYLCRLSLTDPRFPRYPRIPVIACQGFRSGD